MHDENGHHGSDDELDEQDPDIQFYELDLDDIEPYDGWSPDSETPNHDTMLEFVSARVIRVAACQDSGIGSRVREWLAIIAGHPKSKPRDADELDRWQSVALAVIMKLTPDNEKETSPSLPKAALKCKNPAVQGAALLGLHAVGLGHLIQPILSKLKEQ